MKARLAKRKPGFWERTKESWKSMKLWDAEELNKLDWVISAVILMFLFFTCAYGDLMLTGNRSFLMYEHFTDFYKASYEQSHGYYANYLPSTFLAYAIWNLPLYLTGHAPQAMLTNSFINNMWYKLLPVLLYYATSHLIYQIGVEVGFGEKKAKLCKFAFLVFPIGVFSQFIFSQYDIFTVFFMVLGLYFYVRGGLWKFALSFGVAATFKYHALLFFLVLLVLREKKIRNLIKYAVAMALPLMIEVLPNIGNIYFKRNVLGFGVLKFVQKPFTIGFFDGINLVAVVAAFMLVWAYQKKAKDNRELFSWGIFLCVGMSFAIFGFSSWNPQWLLMLVPFLVLNIFMNENGNLLVMVTNVLIVALYIFCSQNLVDEQVMNYGILKYILPGQQFAVRMWDLYMFHDEKMLCSAMWVVLLVYVVFGHPKYHIRKGTEIAKGLVWQIRAAFLVSVFAFVIPASICALGMFQGKIVLLDNSRQDLEPDNIIQVDESSSVSQDLTMEGSVLSNLRIRVYTGEKSISDTLTVELIDKETGTVVYQGEKETDSFTTNSALYSFIGEKVPVEKGKTYELRISSEAEAGSGIGLYCVTADSEAQLLKQTEAREELPASRLQMRVTGNSRRKTVTLKVRNGYRKKRGEKDEADRESGDPGDTGNQKAVIGKDDCIIKAMTAILAGGHILIEDVPGVGKTTLALAFSKALHLEQNRIQFTPDVLPGDVTGFSLYQKATGTFVYQPGAVMCNLLLADEINRTSPKTQAALLEVMEEGKVTVDQVTHELPKPFVVIATQNPVGSAGTSMLPQSQLDRFMICMHIGYPDMKYELEIVKGKITTDPLDLVEPVMNGAELLRLQDEIHKIYIHDAVYQYIGKLVNATRTHALIELGISPRGTIALARMVQALAYLRGRNYVLPVDIEDVFIDVEAHRIQLNGKARVNRVTAEQVLKDILEGTTKPSVVKK